MRLQSKEIQTIIQIAKDIYGETVQVYLFGSRLNDEKRGGDIDLLVRSTGEKKGVLARIRMTARLKLHLGDQKIDVIGDHEDSPVVNIPMSADCYSNLTTEQVRCIDQFIFRFSKLQDSMGAKIFRYILEYLDEDITALPMRDILNRLERYLIIPSADEWTYIRELRNEISHDYPLLETDVAAILNELFSKTDIIFSIYSKLKSVFNNNRHA